MKIWDKKCNDYFLTPLSKFLKECYWINQKYTKKKIKNSKYLWRDLVKLYNKLEK